MLIRLFKRNILKLLFLMVSVLLLAIPLVWLQIHQPSQLHSLNLIFSQHSVFFIIFRCILIGVFLIFWPKIARYFANKQQWPKERIDFWLQQKFRIAGWLIVFELVVCENLLLTLSKIF